jgi:phosphinothricin acetyltransferase
MTDSITVRSATLGDSESLMALQNHYIESSFATFDEAPRTRVDVEKWIEKFSATGPYRLVVAEHNGQLLGFASSQKYRDHPAFRMTIETSIYTAPGFSGRGVGSLMYARLFSTLSNQGLHRAVVGIALPNEASVKLHRKFGFHEIGIFDQYAQKNGQFISSVWMQREL